METNLFKSVLKLMDPKVIRSLLEEFQDSPVDILSEFRPISSPQYDPELKLRYIELSNELERLSAEMQKLVPVEKQRLFAKLYVNHIDVLGDLNQLEEKSLYRHGLRDGFWLALELFAKEPEELENQNGANKDEEKRTEHIAPPRKVRAL